MSDRLPTTVLHEGAYLRLVHENGWEYVEHTRAGSVVAVAARTTDCELVLVEQWRPPVRDLVLELPAGVPEPGEAPDVAAARELLEEAGYVCPDRLTLLAEAPLSAGLSSCRMLLYTGASCRRVAKGGGVEDEDVRVYLVPIATAREWLAALRGVSVDWRIYAALNLLST